MEALRNLEEILYENNQVELMKSIVNDKIKISNEIEREVVRKRFNPFLLNRFFSFCNDYTIQQKVIYVLNRYAFSETEYKDMLYELYCSILPRNENLRLFTFIKKKEEFPDWFIQTIRKYYNNELLSHDDIRVIYQKFMESEEKIKELAKIIFTYTKAYNVDEKEVFEYFPFLKDYINEIKKEIEKDNDKSEEVKEKLKMEMIKKKRRLF